MTMNKRKLQREAQLDQQLDLAAESNKPPNATPYFATQAAMAGAIPLGEREARGGKRRRVAPRIE